jgi:hypothetical protein
MAAGDQAGVMIGAYKKNFDMPRLFGMSQHVIFHMFCWPLQSFPFSALCSTPCITSGIYVASCV